LDINLHETHVSQGSKVIAVTGVVFDPKKETVTVNLAETLEVGPVTIKFRYTGILNELMWCVLCVGVASQWLTFTNSMQWIL
jgi:hypothetical protein